MRPPVSPQAMPAAPVTPASEEALAAAVKAGAAQGQPFVCEGSGSKRHHGPAAAAGARTISLRALSRVTGYDPADMVVSVQAGTRLQDLQRVLAEHRQWLPVDPPYPSATVGGVLATGSAGPRRLGYGTLRDALLGTRIMGLDGTVTRSGGRVVKNVTGYDLHRLQVGAFGALGILLEAHLRVSVRPAVSGALLVTLPGLAQAVRRLLELGAGPLRPVALEVIDGAGAAWLRPAVPELPEGPAVGIIGIEGSRALFDRHLRDLAALRAEARAAAVLEGPAAERLWGALRDAPGRTTGDVVVRIGARPHDLPGLLEMVDPALGVAAVGCHAGNGIARLRFRRPARASELAARLEELGRQARESHGYLVAESAPLDLPERELLPWRHPAVAGGAEVAAALARKLKQAWDPQGLLNPGRTAL
jgi:glycolate oxidase FAD binding subunit